ncbi:MAG: hypothetical protein E6Q59_08055 [Nitrosomonas sp.]|nr:MAG: hypothetical protein E6Q59_08055 [Nitrosomonas sp.]
MFADKNKIFTVKGHVIDQKTRKGVKGLRVEVWDKDILTPDDSLGEVVTDEQGFFQVTFDESQFSFLPLKSSPDLYFKLFQDYLPVAIENHTIESNAEKRAFDVTLTVKIASTTPVNTSEYRVSGLVRDMNGAPLSGYKVIAWDRYQQKDTRLGETKSNPQGFYEIKFKDTDFKKNGRERNAPNLLVRAYDQNGAEIGSAKKDNALLDAVINIDIRTSSENFMVHGYVYASNNTPRLAVANVKIQAFERCNKNDFRPVGTTESDQNGFYQIVLEHSSTAENEFECDCPILIIKAFNNNDSLIGETKPVRIINHETKVDIDVTLYRVYGLVTDSSQAPVPDIIVTAFDRDMRKRQQLGTKKTSSDGKYIIDYLQSDFARSELSPNAPPWLILEARRESEQPPIGVQEIRKANPVQQIDLTVPGTVVSEWQRLSQMIDPLLKGQGESSTAGSQSVEVDLAPADLVTTDIEFIVLETGLDRPAVEAWVASSKMARNAIQRLDDSHRDEKILLETNDAGWILFFGFTRQGLAKDLDVILEETAAIWERAWNAALTASQVPALENSRLQQLLEVLKLLQRLSQLIPAINHDSELVQVLAHTPLPVKVALDALAIFQEKGLEDVQVFLDLANQHPQAAIEIKKFARGVQVHQLVAGHSGLSRVLNEHLDTAQDSKGIWDKVWDTKQFALESIEPLATLSSTQWLGVAEQASVSGAYALQLQAQVENLYPITALQTRIKAENVKFPVAKNEILSFIRDKEETATSIMQGAYPLKDLEGKPVVYKILRNVGLFQRFGISVEQSSYLMEAGIDSPGAALATSAEYLESILVERDIVSEIAAPIVGDFYQEAESTLSATTNAITSISVNWYAGIYLPAIFNNQTFPVFLTENLPSITNLFGDLDQCFCRDCESMLSQSAYLVDLLNLLKNEANLSGSAFQELNKRREDILKLPLGCESEEVIQHITLVLEILEKEVEKIPPNTKAYRQTASAIFPWRFLPFDADYIKAQAYLNKLNVKRYDVLALQADANENSDSEDFKNFKMFLTAETFGLTVSQSAQDGSISEWDLITKTRNQDQLWQVYGFANSGNIVIKDPVSGENINESVGNALNRISVLLDRSGLTLDELEEIITTDEDPTKESQTKFVPGTGGKLIIDKREQCKTSEMRLSLEGSANLEACLDRLHRLVRLHRKLPDWSISQLDQAIVANGNILDASMMIMLAIIHRLNKTLGLSLEYLLDLPRSEAKLRLSLKLSPQQYLLMSAMTGFDLSTKPTDQTTLEKYWIALEKWCGTIARIRDSKLTIEQVAAAVLPYSDLQKHLPPTQTTKKIEEQIEGLLKVVQKRLRAIKAVLDDSDAETQVNEQLTIIFGSDEARKLFAAINSQGKLEDKQKDYLKEKLTNPRDVIRKLGAWQPLFTEAQADSILDKDKETDRFKKFLEEVLIIRQERELIAVITEQCKLPEADVVALLSYRMLLDAKDSESQKASDLFLTKTFWDEQTPRDVLKTIMPRLHTWMERLFRFATFIPMMKLDSELLQLADRVMVGNPAIKGINWHEIFAADKAVNGEHFTALLDLLWLQSENQLSREIIVNLFNQLDGLTGETVESKHLSSVATRVGLTDEQALKIVTQALSPLKSVKPGDSIKKKLYDPRCLKRAFQLLLKAQQIGATDIELQQIADLTNNKQAAETVVKRVQAHASLNEDDWTTTSAKINDLLMQHQRNALVDYLVANNKNNLRNVSDLYEHYLIDPKIEPCFKTSRLNEAISATQLFIHRILFGLERGNVASEQLRNWWAWMRNYRVWEANRKVFLFPENWLYPELRDDKSSSFKQLESKLGQSELTPELAEQAFGEFLDDVAQMGQIQVLGMYEDISQDSNGAIEFDDKGTPLWRKLYVIGRTDNPPYLYFWRVCEDFGGPLMEWLPWQRVELDIQADQVQIFVLRGMLYLAWPLIRSNQREQNAFINLEVKIAWSYFDGRNWKKYKISREPWVGEVEPFSDLRDTVFIHTAVDATKAQNEAILSLYTLQKIHNSAVLPDKAPNPKISTLNLRGVKFWDKNTMSTLIKTAPEFLPIDYKRLLETWCTKKIRTSDGKVDLFYSLLNVFKHDKEYFNLGAVEAHEAHIGAFMGISQGDVPSWEDQLSMFDDFFNEFFDLLTYLRLEDGNLLRTKFNDDIAKSSSQLNLSCRVWIKLKYKYGTQESTSYLEISDQNSNYFNIYIDGNSSTLKPSSTLTSDKSVSYLKLGPTDKKNISLMYTKDFDAGPVLSASGETESIEQGSINDQILHFVIDGTNYFAYELGFQLDENISFSRKTIFLLSDDSITKKSGNDSILPNWIEGARPWMNGYLENYEVDDRSLRITNHLDQQIDIFPELKTESFMVVGATTSSSSEIKAPFIWHYTENRIRRYIDLFALSHHNLQEKKYLFPDSYQEIAHLRSHWNKFLTLDPKLQNITFGADENPQPILSDTNWEKIKNGALSFDASLPYACYNWEVFFHAPLMIADQLSKQHKFEDAERWLRYVFDPTANKSGEGAKGALNFRVFRELDLNKQVIDDLTALAQAAGGFATSADIKTINNLITRWRNMPFRPFVIARQRPIAFLWRTLFAYLDNLIAWADSLYRQDRRESLTEARMLYGLAEKILGRRPQQHPGKSKRKFQSFNEIAANWDSFANFWIDTTTSTSKTDPKTSLKQFKSNKPSDDRSTIRPRDGENRPYPNPNGMLYFCMPWNDKITGYWKIIDDRLFNLRNCRNIEGIERELPLKDPQIDPELLVRAVAAGLNLGDVISGLYAPPPHYRYTILSARAAELANEVKALGAAMLSAIEKRDAEEMALLRSSNELSMLKLVQEVRKKQIEEADENLKALGATRKTTGARYSQYQRLLGKKDIKIPESNTTASDESMLGNIDGLASARSNWGLIKEENEQYTGIEGAKTWSTAAGISKASAGVLHAVAVAPQTVLVAALGHAASAVGDGFSIVSQEWRAYAEQQGMMAGHIRRRDEWAFQSNQALKELQQIDKQILANKIRKDITDKELANHIEQLEQAKATDEVMRSKFSNQQLYQWMVSQLSGLYFNAYRMALDMARRAERAAARELGVQPLNILGNEYWDSLRNGLLAGERLHQDLKRLENNFLEKNRREFELTKHISLRRLDPQALVELRLKDCKCGFDVPEWVFDLDTPGHYMRRIKSVSVSIPCVTGPYTNISCKLTLLKSRIRYDRIATETDYAQDSHFTDYFGASEAMVTSTGNADSGMFEPQLRDERFLPFESSGVISSWRLELPADFPQFDYSTISDVILTIRYTARDGGDSLKVAATKSITSLLESVTAQSTPSDDEPKQDKKPLFPVLLSCRSDFSTEWAQARNTSSKLKIQINNDLLPYWMEAARLEVLKVSVKDLTKDSKVIDKTEGVTKTESIIDLGEVGTAVIDRLVLLSMGSEATKSGLDSTD